MTSKDAYTPQYPSPPLSHSSHDSEDSLRALELSEGPEFIPATGRVRSYSVGGFDFERDLLPLSSSLSEPDETRPVATEKSIGLINGIALIVGLQIGSGIFSSPGVVVANTRSVGASLSVWLVSGLLAWTGASSFAELGSAIPLNGGAQAYLAYSYGPLVSYLFAWTAIAALKPGSNAVISLVFAEYLNRLFWHTTRGDVSSDSIPQWAIQVTAIVAVLLITLICVAAKSLGTRTAVVFTTVKIFALISITILGLVQLIRGRQSTSFSGDIWEGASTSPSSYALALYSGLWAFDGWDQANYVGGEMKRPEKNIPRAIHTSMLVVTATITIAFILVGGQFRSLINFAVVASWAFYFLTVLGVVVLRFKEPTLERPYKTWITTPLIFCAVALFLLCMPVVAAPLQALAVLGFVLVGIPMYYLTQRTKSIRLPRQLSFLSSWIAKLSGPPTVAPGFGWEAVATEGDEGVEMTRH
ncbi:hypothetical protein EWM64_g4606 [Hericium alpestre]|uniref:Amino acid permease/ SLC12A domain-containing protein n=1 Tax=Hericium alpestre TaxID=135208 RepID=A0A4Z0A0U9_9AGAM|nr:hypothetical protein EWM64_g4606 [Hericium alpestre]